MDVINKLYSSVSSTVSQLSGVLPGNAVTREFEITNHIGSAGPDLLWKIYSGYKKSTKQEAAVFVFEKRHLDRWSKSDRDIILESLKRGVVQLTKLRHPQILTVQHPLEESRECLAFATEPVFASLANALGQTANMPMPPPAELTDYKFFEVEIKYGLLQVGEGLAFLHNDVKLLHRNICTESIIINKQGAWKIFGFDFCVLNESPPNNQPFWPFAEYSPHLPSVCQPSLSFLAPEYTLTESHSAASDMFSLGMVAYTLYSPQHQPIMPCTDYQTFKKRAQQLKQLPASKLQPVADGLRDYVKMMLNTNPELRPDAHQFVKVPFFDDIGVKTLNYLDSLFQWDNIQKSQFYRGLPEALIKLPPRVRLLRVLPCLVKDLVQPLMVPFVLPNVLAIAEHCEKEQFVRHILPYLRPVMRLTEPIQILLIFVQKMELLLKLTPADEVQREVLPMLYRGLDGDAHQIHELCLSALPTFAGLLDHAAVKNSVLPRIKRLCLSTNSLSVRVNCLLCLGRLLEHLDKWLVLDEVLPFLPQIPSREPAVLMGILGIYKMALDHKKLGITKEVIASRILPFLIPLCIENGLTMTQFNALVTLVKRMFEIVESEHRNKLQQLNSVQNEKKSLEMSFASNSPITQRPTDPKLDEMFSGLGLDKYFNASPTHAPAPEPPRDSNAGQLSLQEKQRLANQQDAVKLLHNQPVLAPVPSPNPKAPSTPKDLSSSLQQWPSSSLPPGNNQSQPWVQSPPQNFVRNFPPIMNSNISTGQTTMGQNSSGQTAINQNTSNFSGGQISNFSIGQTAMGQNSNNFNTGQNAMGQTSSNFTTGQTAMGQNSNNFNTGQNSSSNFTTGQTTMGQNSWTNPWGSTNTNKMAANGATLSQNWSALDTLLPTTTQKVPMNQMMNQMAKQPLLQAQAQSRLNETKNSNAALSSDEIMDLLN